MSDKLNVSIVLPIKSSRARDFAEYFGKAIQSIKNQIVGVDELVINLRYIGNRKPVITEITKVSKSGRRNYVAASDVGSFFNGLGIAILSTSSGVLANSEAFKRNVGGELICKIF